MLRRSPYAAFCAVLLTLATLTGCKTFDTSRADPTAVQAAKLAVQYGTMRYIGHFPESDRAPRALRVRQIVSDVQAGLTGQTVSLTVVKQLVMQRLPADLKPEDQFAVNALLDLVMAELQARVGDGLLNENQLLQVGLVASWIVEATRFYSAGA